ncbi:MAG: amidohydrolase family protein [bacterium]|nr:amidohydrolase family protein [bacterium]
MIIDSHAHIGFNEHLNKSPEELISSMEKAGIDISMVYAGEINDCSNDRLLKELENFKGKLFPVGSISPLSKDKPSLDKFKEWLDNKKIFGVKFYPGYEPFYPYDEVLKPYFKIMEERKVPAIFHNGDTYNLKKGAKLKYAHPLHIDDLAVDFPELPIIIAHLGYPWMIDAAEVAYKNKNVYVDCSGLFYGEIGNTEEEMVKKFLDTFVEYAGGTDKLIFGTDWPISNQADYVRIIKNVFKDREDLDNILFKNSVYVFNIKL